MRAGRMRVEAVFGNVRICYVESGRARRESLQNAGGKLLVYFFGPGGAHGVSWVDAAKPSIVVRSVRVRRGVWDIGIGAARGMERRERGSTLLFPVPLVEKMEKIDDLVLPPPPLGQEHLLQRGRLLPLPFSPRRLDFNRLNRNLYQTQVPTRA